MSCRRADRRLLAATVAAAVLVAGCEAFQSDAESYARHERAERARRLAGMRAATAQQPAGTYLSADTLAAALSGKTHVFVYQSAPGGRPGRYVEYAYFRPDGHFVYRNTAWAIDPNGREADRWRVDGDRICILSTDMSSDEQCFRLAVLANGRVQYFIDAPGTETHGLLTKVTDAIQDGQPRVETPLPRS